MAKLSAHGAEIGRVYFSTYAKAYMADGKILKNNGFGWKLHGKVKPGISPKQAFDAAKGRQDAFLKSNPHYAEYLRQLHDIAGLCKRWKIALAIELMPDNPDGVWSEVCDSYSDNVSADISEINGLCMAYQLAIKEAKERQEQKAA